MVSLPFICFSSDGLSVILFYSSLTPHAPCPCPLLPPPLPCCHEWSKECYSLLPIGWLIDFFVISMLALVKPLNTSPHLHGPSEVPSRCCLCLAVIPPTLCVFVFSTVASHYTLLCPLLVQTKDVAFLYPDAPPTLFAASQQCGRCDCCCVAHSDDGGASGRQAAAAPTAAATTSGNYFTVQFRAVLDMPTASGALERPQL